MPSLLRKWMSHLFEQLIERAESPVSGWLEVWLAYGHYELNTSNVNYSFGELHKVFKEAFFKLKMAEKYPQSVLLLGLGAGSVVQLLREIGITAPIVAVELDPVAVRLGRKYFGLNEVRQLEILEGVDALQWLPAQSRKFDLIVIDLFVGEEVPSGVSDPAFLSAIQRSLNARGWMMWNRLAHEKHLERATQQFHHQLEVHFPAMISVSVRGNQMLVWQKPH